MRIANSVYFLPNVERGCHEGDSRVNIHEGDARVSSAKTTFVSMPVRSVNKFKTKAVCVVVYFCLNFVKER